MKIPEIDPRRYDSIIDLPHPVSKRHLPMSLHDRAAQFAPFAALTGYDAAIAETARLTDCRLELTEDEQQALNERITLLQDHLHEHPAVTFTYFQPDERKQGGAYVQVTGVVKKIDAFERMITLMDGRSIPMDELLALDGHIFDMLIPED